MKAAIDVWPEIIEAGVLLERNGRWGTCGFCPREGGTVFPERCQHKDRRDHLLQKSHWDAMCGRWMRHALDCGPS